MTDERDSAAQGIPSKTNNHEQANTKYIYIRIIVIVYHQLRRSRNIFTR